MLVSVRFPTSSLFVLDGDADEKTVHKHTAEAGKTPPQPRSFQMRPAFQWSQDCPRPFT